ncbi:MAG TPA: hypothetical protein VFT94_04415 [Gaiellaceae bacterium]|nr:hypothetical protein [Gaiellaceae bacterium]
MGGPDAPHALPLPPSPRSASNAATRETGACRAGLSLQHRFSLLRELLAAEASVRRPQEGEHREPGDDDHERQAP